MTPEQLVQILVALNVAGLLANLSQWWTRRQETSTTRQYSWADQIRARDQEREERLLSRISELEDAQASREASMQAEIQQLRQGLEACQQQHSAAQIIAAGLQAENATMRRQLDSLMHNLDRRHREDGPPPGQPERRDR